MGHQLSRFNTTPENLLFDFFSWSLSPSGVTWQSISFTLFNGSTKSLGLVINLAADHCGSSLWRIIILTVLAVNATSRFLSRNRLRSLGRRRFFFRWQICRISYPKSIVSPAAPIKTNPHTHSEQSKSCADLFDIARKSNHQQYH